jgi:hypothetical protein
MRETSQLPKAKKHSAIARGLLSAGVYVATALTGPVGTSIGQQCDRCAGIPTASHEPACGCETQVRPQTCKKTCTPTKLSFAEKFLKRLDKIGDEIEGRIARPCSKPSCDVVISTEPSCGCEVCSSSSTCESMAEGVVVPKNGQTFPDNPSKHAIGTIGDQFSSAPPVPKTTPPVVKPNSSLPPIVRGPNATPPVGSPSPSASTTTSPFEKRTPDAKRIPADETKAVEAPNTNQAAPPASLPTIPNNSPPANTPQRLPDVLVDPFKDDPSAMNGRSTRNNVMLTGGSHFRKPGFKLKKPTAETEPVVIPEGEMPAPLTPAQREVPNIQIEAREPMNIDTSSVVPTSYYEPVPVKTLVRRPVATDDQPVPNVNKVRVPARR